MSPFLGYGLMYWDAFLNCWIDERLLVTFPSLHGNIPFNLHVSS